MKIKLSSIYATASRTAQPGSIIDVPDAEGQALIDGRYAVEVNEVPAAKPAAPAADTPAGESPPAENASTAAPENASQRRGGRRSAKPAAPAADTPAA